MPKSLNFALIDIDIVQKKELFSQRVTRSGFTKNLSFIPLSIIIFRISVTFFFLIRLKGKTRMGLDGFGNI